MCVALIAVLASSQFIVTASIPAGTPPSNGVGTATSRKNAVQITFRQLYFPPTRKGVAVRALTTLLTDPESPFPAELADHDVLPSRFDNVTIGYVTELFGKTFAETVKKLPVGRWGGPVRSELGWHLVWVDSVSTEQPQASRAVEPSNR